MNYKINFLGKERVSASVSSVPLFHSLQTLPLLTFIISTISFFRQCKWLLVFFFRALR